MMRLRLTLAFVLVAVPALAWAQTYKCKDDRGKIVYLSVPRAGCTDMQGRPVTGKDTPTQPAPAARTSAAALPGSPPPRPAPKPIGALPSDPAQRTVDCRGYKQQLDWLNGPEGSKTENHGARVSQVKQAMRGCS